MTATAALALAGCIPAPTPPPSGWVPPVVTATVSPDPVVAGEPFTIDVTATDVTGVSSILIKLTPPVGLPSSTTNWSEVDCEAGTFTPAPAAERSFTCELPPLAPNGAWRLAAHASSTGAPGHYGSTTRTVEVTGGSDDVDAPVLTSVLISPNPVVIGQPFAVTIQASDAHHAAPAPTSLGANIVLPAPPEGTVNWTCSPATPTPISDTLMEWRFTDCLIPAGSSAWTYAGGIRVEDALGFYRRLSFSFQAVTG